MGFGIATRVSKVYRAGAYWQSRVQRAMCGASCPACGERRLLEVWTQAPRWIEMCSRCGHGVTMPLVPPARQARRHADVYAWPPFVETYLRSYAPVLDHSFARGLERIARHAGGGGRLLDVGCAFGYFLDKARAAGFDVAGIEVSGPAAARGVARYGVDIEIGALSDTRRDARSFDVVTAWDVLEHCADPASVLAGIVQLMKPSGLLLLRVPDFSFRSRGFPADFVREYMAHVYPVDAGEHAHHFTRSSLERFLGRARLEVVEEWASAPDEYTVKDTAEYAAALRRMERLGVACELNVLCRLAEAGGR